MHKDITKILGESQHKGYTIKIVERKMSYRDPFLFLYVLDETGNTCGGLNYFGYDNVKEEDLMNLDIAIPKIKSCIDGNIAFHEKCKQEELEKKKEMNWTGRRFKRGDFVHFKGNDKYKPKDTYVWTHFGHLSLDFYLIEHERGVDRSNFLSSGSFPDGFESVHSSLLQEGLKYLQIDCVEFTGETDELIMLKESE